MPLNRLTVGKGGCLTDFVLRDPNSIVTVSLHSSMFVYTDLIPCIPSLIIMAEAFVV